MPEKTVYCRVCGKGIRGYDFEERMEKLRRHYKREHPRKWRESVAKALATKLERGVIDEVRDPRYKKLVTKILRKRR